MSITSYKSGYEYLLEQFRKNVNKDVCLLFPNEKKFNLFYKTLIKNIFTLNGGKSVTNRFTILLPFSIPDKKRKHLLNQNLKHHYFEEIPLLDEIIIAIDKHNIYSLNSKGSSKLQLAVLNNREKKWILCLLDTISKQTTQNQDVLNKTNRIQTDFINICAHELRAPIHPILFQSDKLLRKMDDPNSRKEIESIYNNALRLGRIVDDLLEMTRIESDLFNLNKERFSLNDVIISLVTYYGQLLSNRLDRSNKLKIKFVDTNMTYFIDADKERVNQALVNLITNSLKFTESGTILISLHKWHENEVEIKISDTGQGIDPKIFPHLFTKFSSTSTKGLGLGLYITKNIIESHAGKIWAENNLAEMKGSTFHIVLPTITQLKKDENHNLLLIDDEKNFISEIKPSLTSLGFSIDIISNLSMLEKNYTYGYYSMIILDYALKNDEELDIIKKIKLKDGIKICYLTKGRTNYDSFRTLFGVDKDDIFVNKNLKIDKIIEKIHSFHKS